MYQDVNSLGGVHIAVMVKLIEIGQAASTTSHAGKRAEMLNGVVPRRDGTAGHPNPDQLVSHTFTASTPVDIVATAPRRSEYKIRLTFHRSRTGLWLDFCIGR